VTLASIALARLSVFVDAGITAIHGIAAELASFQPYNRIDRTVHLFYLIA
jgi:hypothetical protein